MSSLKNVMHPKAFLFIDAIKDIIYFVLVYIDCKFKEEICNHLMKTASTEILN